MILISAFIFCTWPGNLVIAMDVLELMNRATLEGKILNPAEVPRQSWQVQVAEGIVVDLPNRKAVDRLVTQPLAVQQYYAKVPFLPESAETHLKLAEVCMVQRLEDLAKLHYQRVLDFDPENMAARQALNHRKIGGEWTSSDEIMLRQGYVKTNRGWTTPQKLLIDERQVQIGQEHHESSHIVQNLIARLKTTPSPVAENALYNLAYPGTVPALAEALKNEFNPEFREIYLKALAKIGSGPAFYEIAQWSIHETDENIRQTCIKIMQSSSGLAKFFVPYLANQDNTTVNRAAYIIGQLNDRATIPDLINALITQHELAVNRQASQQKKELVLISNPEVLGALRKMSGMDFGYEVPIWWDWWTKQNQFADFDARRGSRD